MLLLIIIVSFSACSKDYQDVAKENIQTPEMKLNYSKKRATVNDDATLGCDGEETNCTILVGPPVRPSLISAIDNSISNGSVSIGKLFTTNAEVQGLVSGLDPTELSKLQSGNYNLIKTHESESFVTYIAGSNSDLSLSNLDFGFQIMK